MTKHHHHHQHLPKNLENASEFRLFVYHLIESKLFGVAILFVILLNTVILITQTNEEVDVKAGTICCYDIMKYNMINVFLTVSSIKAWAVYKLFEYCVL